MAEKIFSDIETELKKYLELNKLDFIPAIQASSFLKIGLITTKESYTIQVETESINEEDSDNKWKAQVLEGNLTHDFDSCGVSHCMAVDNFTKELISKYKIHYERLLAASETEKLIDKALYGYNVSLHSLFHHWFKSTAEIHMDDNYSSPSAIVNEKSLYLNPKKIFELACFYYVELLSYLKKHIDKVPSFYDFYIMYAALIISYQCRYKKLGFDIPGDHGLGYIKEEIMRIFVDSFINIGICNEFNKELNKFTNRQDINFILVRDVHGSQDFKANITDGLKNICDAKKMLDYVIGIAKDKGIGLASISEQKIFPIKFDEKTIIINFEFPYSAKKIFNDDCVSYVRFCHGILQNFTENEIIINPNIYQGAAI